jgi:hypothetical protein
MYIQSVSGRDILRNILRLLLLGSTVAVLIFWGLHHVAQQTVVVAEKLAAQQDEEARESAWEQIKTLESQFTLSQQAYLMANSEQEKQEVLAKQKEIQRRYHYLWKRESRWGNDRLCGEFPAKLILSK